MTSRSPSWDTQVESGRHSCLLFWQENNTFNALPLLASLQMADVVKGKALPRGQAGCLACYYHPNPPLLKGLMREEWGSSRW